MAEGAVGFVLEKLDAALSGEKKLLRGVREEAHEIKAELESIRSLLKHKHVHAIEESHPTIKGWVKQVREVSYDIEDVLDKYALRIAAQPHGQGFLNFLLRCIHPIKRLTERHGVAMEMQDLKTRVRNIAERKQRYDSNSLEHDGIISSATASDKLHYCRDDALVLKDADVVGISERRDDLIEWLVRKGDSRLGVYSVYGTGGLGKTTLVRNVYDSWDVKKHFTFQAWVTVSQWSNTKEILTDLVCQLTPTKYEVNNPREIVNTDNAKLSQLLKKCLEENRYVFVFDDVWDIDEWRGIKNALPESNCGSRIMVTTRFSNIAQSCVENPEYALKLQPLSSEYALTLFCRKAFKSNSENTCPPELEDTAKAILSRCDGLPLAVVLIADYLSIRQQTLTAWDEVYRSLGFLLETHPFLSGINFIFSLSYNDLPDYLKSCFLYLSIFPKSYPLSCRRLTRLWIAEGFVEKGNDNRTLEEVAEGYLDELIQRSLIEVGDRDSGGRLRTCRVHDLMHDFILREAREQNLYRVLEKEDDANSFPDKIRRLSILNGEENIPNSLSLSQIQSLRSFFWFRVGKLSNHSIPTLLSGSRLLKVVDLEDACGIDFPSELSNQFRLLYLSLNNTEIKSLPSFLWKLTNLETLNLKGTYVRKLPPDIRKLPRLRFLLGYLYRNNAFGGKLGMKLPMEVRSLTALEKLSCFNADGRSDVLKELKSLTRLRRLGITNLREEDGLYLCASVEKMEQLRSFDIASANSSGVLDIKTLNPPKFLQRLYLKGRLEKIPCWISSLKSLEKLHLMGSRLEGDDPLRPLQELPVLAELKLHWAYAGEFLSFKARKFQRLKHLELIGLSKLNTVEINDEAMPSIQIISFQYCEELEKVPLGIKQLTSLKMIQIGKMPQEFENRIKSRDCWKPEHFPFIKDLDSETAEEFLNFMEEEREQIRKKIQEHAQVIRAALLFREVGERIQ